MMKMLSKIKLLIVAILCLSCGIVNAVYAQRSETMSNAAKQEIRERLGNPTDAELQERYMKNKEIMATTMPSDHFQNVRNQQADIIIKNETKNLKLEVIKQNDSEEEKKRKQEANQKTMDDHEKFKQDVYDHFADPYMKALTENQMINDLNKLDARSNAGFCDIKGLKESYMGNCYSCTIVAALISTFMDVADKTAPLTQQAGVRLMIIGMFLWIAFYVLKQMASLVMPEPMKMVQDLLKFFFKCLIAYTLITSGISVVSKMLVEPLLSFGAEYGNTIIDVTTPKIADIDKYGKFDTKDYNSNLISEAIFGKIMTLSKKADAAVSLNFVIGDALACHAHHAGAITVAKKVQEILHIEFYFPDFWLWLCGIAIWFMGLMVVIGINFYLLDLSFKVGFGLLALPITLGLWPFDKFQSKFTECIKLIVNAAGTFMFLGISVGITVTLISAALGGTDELFAAIENDNKRYVADQFSLSGAKFLLVAFAFFYSHKLISETVSGLTDKFFGSSLAGGMNHMHTMAVGTTAYLGNAVKDKVGGTVGRITKGIGKGADALTEKAMGGALKGLKKGGRAIGRLASKLK